jgi:hypothetical protein
MALRSEPETAETAAQWRTDKMKRTTGVTSFPHRAAEWRMRIEAAAVPRYRITVCVSCVEFGPASALKDRGSLLCPIEWKSHSMQ